MYVYMTSVPARFSLISFIIFHLIESLIERRLCFTAASISSHLIFECGGRAKFRIWRDDYRNFSSTQNGAVRLLFLNINFCALYFLSLFDVGYSRVDRWRREAKEEMRACVCLLLLNLLVTSKSDRRLAWFAPDIVWMWIDEGLLVWQEID